MKKNYIKNRLVTIFSREVGYQVSRSLKSFFKSKNKKQNLTYKIDDSISYSGQDDQNKGYGKEMKK
ncbi:MAG: hypothetical protein MJ181_01845 [Treponema sp.]|nr:hypothetical protein [Treponema sp.]